MRNWVSVKKELPPEGQHVDIWLERGVRVADCYWELHKMGDYECPLWFFRNGFSAWKQFQRQDITHWMYKPKGPNGEASKGFFLDATQT